MKLRGLLIILFSLLLTNADAQIADGLKLIQKIPGVSKLGEKLGINAGEGAQLAQLIKVVQELQTIKKATEATIATGKSLNEMVKSVFKDAQNLGGLEEAEFKEITGFFTDWDFDHPFIDFNEVYLGATEPYRSPNTGNITLWQAVKNTNSPQGYQLNRDAYYTNMQKYYTSVIQLNTAMAAKHIRDANRYERLALIFRLKAQKILMMQGVNAAKDLMGMAGESKIGSSLLGDKSIASALKNMDQDDQAKYSVSDFRMIMEYASEYLVKAQRERMLAAQTRNIAIPGFEAFQDGWIMKENYYNNVLEAHNKGLLSMPIEYYIPGYNNEKNNSIPKMGPVANGPIIGGSIPKPSVGIPIYGSTK